MIFNDHRIDPDTGAAKPPVPPSAYQATGKDGLYVLVLRGFPTEAWLADLKERNIRLLEALPPAAYLARGDRGLMSAVKNQVSYLRGVFPVTPGMKKVLFASAPSASPFRKVAVRAVEESPQESLKNHLEVVADEVISARASGGLAEYIVSIADGDIDNLTYFETVYTISAIGEPDPSSERQGVLVLQPTVNGGRLELAASNPSYSSILVSKGISNFSNSIVAALDTGFDNGVTGTGRHGDFSSGVVECAANPFGGSCADRDTHGTITAAIITAHTPFGTRSDAQSYRYCYGLAPTVKFVAEKFYECGGAKALVTSLNNLQAHPSQPNVVNFSLNYGGTGYDANSREMDRRTRLNNWLFTVSAGNVVGTNPANPRPPATAKNVIAVGATENFTLNWPHDGLAHPQECDWSTYPPGTPPYYPAQDARNIPTFSPQRLAGSMWKPDLVAPAVRVTGPFSRNPTLCAGGGSVFCNRNIAQFGDIIYGFSAGTSWAAPAAAGAAAVVRKWYNNVKFTNPSPAMTKAILINGARTLQGGNIHGEDNLADLGDVQHITFDPYQGWGMLNLERLLGRMSRR